MTTAGYNIDFSMIAEDSYYISITDVCIHDFAVITEEVGDVFLTMSGFKDFAVIMEGDNDVSATNDVSDSDATRHENTHCVFGGERVSPDNFLPRALLNHATAQLLTKIDCYRKNLLFICCLLHWLTLFSTSRINQIKIYFIHCKH